MATLMLRVIAANATLFEGEVDRVVVRTTEGDVGFLHGHIPYVAALGVGPMTVVMPDGEKKTAAVSHGLVKADRESVTVLAHACEWAEDIDLDRAEAAKEHAEKVLQSAAGRKEHDRAEVKLKRALVRLSVGGDR